MSNISESVYEIIRRFVYGTGTNKVHQILSSHTEEEVIKMFERPSQDECKHVKGGKIQLPLLRRDYAIADHTFTDGTRRVWCLICDKPLDPKDPETTRMLESTTNRRTTSEVLNTNYRKS